MFRINSIELSELKTREHFDTSTLVYLMNPRQD